MTAHPLRTASSMAATLAPEFRVITKIFGGLLGPDFITAVGDRYYRIGQPTLNQLKRGVPADEIDMLECDEDGEPL